MKILYLVRHAKSSWKEPELKDDERPLNKRGKWDAPAMAKRLRKMGDIPDLMISSPAKRAFNTAKRFAGELKYPGKKIQKSRELYMGSTSDFVAVISNVKDKYKSVMLFGHNPGLTEFVNKIGTTNIDNVPTSGVVRIDFDFKDWGDVKNAKGKMKFFEYPKKGLNTKSIKDTKNK